MIIPDTLAGWTLDVVRGLAALDTFETDRFDFKEQLPHPKDEKGKLRLRKTAAAFANSIGGFLVLGVKDDRGLSPEDRLVGIASSEDLPAHFGAVVRHLEPSIAWTPKNPPIALATGTLLHVIHVHASPSRPHGLRVDDKWFIPKRTNAGNEAMSHAELVAAFSRRAEKVAKLRFVVAELQHIHDIAAKIRTDLHLYSDSTEPFSLDLGPTVALLPEIFEFVSEHDRTVPVLLSNLRDQARGAETARSECRARGDTNGMYRVAVKLAEAAHNAIHALKQLEPVRGG